MRQSGAMMVLAVALAARAGAQQWTAGDRIDLIRRAVARRTARNADTLLSAWQAEARGVLRYASVLDQGDSPVERVIRADQLRVEVYGEAPNRSKQIIVAWRDTTFLPNQLTYHRDHLGIVANDFGPTIRLGQGDEVRDVPHPLSDAGLDAYQFAPGDTVVLSSPRGKVRVTAVEVRPKQPLAMGVVGTLYLDLDRAELVRFRFTFTPASYRDRTVEDITVTLENALQQNARWLPWRQSIVIRRQFPLVELPVRTVIRADWIIDDYQFGMRQPADRFASPFIAGPKVPEAGAWDTTVLPRLAALPATEADVLDAQRAALRALGRAVDGLPRLRILGSGISDFLRVNRVEGVTPAIGARIVVGSRLLASGRIGIGISDRRVVGNVALATSAGLARWSLRVERTVRDVADVPVVSGVANSLSTAVSGVDYGDYVLLERAAVGVAFASRRTRYAIEAAEERSRSVSTAFESIAGTTAPNPALGAGQYGVIRAAVADYSANGTGWGVEVERGDGSRSWVRLHAMDRRHISLSNGELQTRVEIGMGSAGLPAYRNFVLGGRGTLPGVPFRSLGGRRMARAEVAWARPVRIAAPSVPYSRYVYLPSTLAAFLAAGVAGGETTNVPWRATGRVEPVAGLRLDLWGPLLRLEAGVALRSGQMGLFLDVHPDWWGLM